jgi:hypothetical protein
MTSEENLNENLHKPISGIFAKKFMGPHCNAHYETSQLIWDCSLKSQLNGKNKNLKFNFKKLNF